MTITLYPLEMPCNGLIKNIHVCAHESGSTEDPFHVEHHTSKHTPPTSRRHKEAHTFHVEHAGKQVAYPKRPPTLRKKPVSLQPKKSTKKNGCSAKTCSTKRKTKSTIR